MSDHSMGVAVQATGPVRAGQGGDESAFARSLGLEALETGSYAVEITPDWHVVRGPNGGYLAAVLLAAMQSHLRDSSRSPRVLSVHYPKVPKAGPARVDVRALRVGRKVTWLEADLVQDGVCVAARAAFSVPWDGLDVDVLERPRDVAPEAGMPKFAGMPPFTANFDYRSHYSTPLGRDGSGFVGGHIRPERALAYDAPLLAALSDAWFPGMFAHAGRPVMAATLDLTVHFRDTQALSELSVGDYVHSLFSTRLSNEGFFEEDGELWSPDGRLLAQSRQLALAVPMGG